MSKILLAEDDTDMRRFLVKALQNAVLTEGRYRKPVEPVLLLNLVWVLSRKPVRSEANEGEAGLSRSASPEAAV